MKFWEQLRPLERMQRERMEDVLAYISLAVMTYSTFYHDKGSLIFASLCASYLPAAIAVVAVKTRQWPSKPGWASVVLCGGTLLAVARTPVYT